MVKGVLLLMMLRPCQWQLVVVLVLLLLLNMMMVMVMMMMLVKRRCRRNASSITTKPFQRGADGSSSISGEMVQLQLIRT